MLKEKRIAGTKLRVANLENTLGRKLTKKEKKAIQKNVLMQYRKTGKLPEEHVTGINSILKSTLSKDANPVDHFVHLILRWCQLLEAGKEYKVINCTSESVKCKGLSIGNGNTSGCSPIEPKEGELSRDDCSICGGTGKTGGLWILTQRTQDQVTCAFELIVFQDLIRGKAEIVCTGQFEHKSQEEIDANCDIKPI